VTSIVSAPLALGGTRLAVTLLVTQPAEAGRCVRYILTLQQSRNENPLASLISAGGLQQGSRVTGPYADGPLRKDLMQRTPNALTWHVGHSRRCRDNLGSLVRHCHCFKLMPPPSAVDKIRWQSYLPRMVKDPCFLHRNAHVRVR
jgi:hypothetical protein